MVREYAYLFFVWYMVSLGLSSCMVAGGENEHIVMSDLYWVVGEWKGRVQGGMMFESWEIAEDGSMEGNACTIARGDTIFSESMQIIDKDGDIFYMVKLADVKKTVAFKLVEISSKGCVFENNTTQLISNSPYGSATTCIMQGCSSINNSAFC